MIILKTAPEIEKMREAGRLVALALDEVCRNVVPGRTTADLDRIAEMFVREHGGTPAFKGYRGYPATLCVSINEEVVHGIPSDRKLREGDILAMDLGVVLDGFHGDAARTVPVGSVSRERSRLMRVTKEALAAGTAQAWPGHRLSDIGAAVQAVVEAAGFSVVRAFVGHGIGRDLHEEPQIPNYGVPRRGPQLRAGMTLAIEPMVNMGKPDVKILADGWTAVAVDGKVSAHFEHTVAVTEDGPRVLTEV